MYLEVFEGTLVFFSKIIFSRNFQANNPVLHLNPLTSTPGSTVQLHPLLIGEKFLFKSSHRSANLYVGTFTILWDSSSIFVFLIASEESMGVVTQHFYRKMYPWIVAKETRCMYHRFRKSCVLISESNGMLPIRCQNWSPEAGFNSYIISSVTSSCWSLASHL